MTGTARNGQKLIYCEFEEFIHFKNRRQIQTTVAVSMEIFEGSDMLECIFEEVATSSAGLAGEFARPRLPDS